MKKNIVFSEQAIDVFFKKSSKAKRLRVVVYAGGEVMVVVPHGLSFRDAEKFIQSKSDWIREKFQQQSKKKTLLRQGDKQDYRRFKKMALNLVKKRLEKINHVYGFSYNKILIRDQKTRWGSCSWKKNLSFNYRIIFLPLKYVDYIITHELCHLQEFNHSSRFWELVEKTIPKYREIKKKLKDF